MRRGRRSTQTTASGATTPQARIRLTWGANPQVVRQLAEPQQDGELQPRQPHDPEDQSPPGSARADGRPERGAQAELERREDRDRPLRIVNRPVAAVLDKQLPPVHRPVQEVAQRGPTASAATIPTPIAPTARRAGCWWPADRADSTASPATRIPATSTWEKA